MDLWPGFKANSIVSLLIQMYFLIGSYYYVSVIIRIDM